MSEALCIAAMLESGGGPKSPFFLETAVEEGEWTNSNPRPLNALQEVSLFPLDQRLCGTQNRCGGCGANILALLGTFC
jgi:hypothetical protein